MESNSNFKKTKISVLMSAYNSDKYIDKTINSILTQSYKNFEFIIVDDGSTDNTLDILKKYSKQDKKIKLIINNKNLGLTKSLNKALKLSKSKYIARIDADDLSLENRLQKQFDYLEENKDIAACGTQGIYIDENNKELGKKLLPTSYKNIKNKLIFNNQFIHSSLFIRKSVLDKVGVYNEKFRTSQDYELMLRIAEKNKVTNLDIALVKWRVHNNSISWTSKKQEIDALKARCFAITKYNYPKLKGLSIILARIIWMFVPLSIKKKRYL
jgi:glycosyltransferase involved in cell wall biosynthesis